MTRLRWLLLASLLLSAGSARAALELVGLRTTAGATQFVLADAEAGTRSAWLGLNQTFGGYTIASYDPKGEVVVVTRDGARTELRLKEAKVQNSITVLGLTFPLTAETLPSFDPVPSPEMLQLMLETAKAREKVAQQRYEAGVSTYSNLLEAGLPVKLLEAQIAGDRPAFARAILQVTETAYGQTSARMNVGSVKPEDLSAAQAVLELARTRLIQALAASAPPAAK